MFSRAILDELPDCIFEHFEIAQAEQRQLQNFKTYKDELSAKSQESKTQLMITLNLY